MNKLNRLALAALIAFISTPVLAANKADKIGTSPLTNCSFDMRASNEAFDIAIVTGG